LGKQREVTRPPWMADETTHGREPILAKTLKRSRYAAADHRPAQTTPNPMNQKTQRTQETNPQPKSLSSHPLTTEKST
jgi:hypothetical protein